MVKMHEDVLGQVLGHPC